MMHKSLKRLKPLVNYNSQPPQLPLDTAINSLKVIFNN